MIQGMTLDLLDYVWSLCRTFQNISVSISTYGIDNEITFMSRSVGGASCNVIKESGIGIEEVWVA